MQSNWDHEYFFLLNICMCIYIYISRIIQMEKYAREVYIELDDNEENPVMKEKKKDSAKHITLPTVIKKMKIKYLCVCVYNGTKGNK